MQPDWGASNPLPLLQQRLQMASRVTQARHQRQWTWGDLKQLLSAVSQLPQVCEGRPPCQSLWVYPWYASHLCKGLSLAVGLAYQLHLAPETLYSCHFDARRSCWHADGGLATLQQQQLTGLPSTQFRCPNA